MHARTSSLKRAIFLNCQVAAAQKERSLSHLFIPLKSIGQKFHTGDSHERTYFVQELSRELSAFGVDPIAIEALKGRQLLRSLCSCSYLNFVKLFDI